MRSSLSVLLLLAGCNAGLPAAPGQPSDAGDAGPPPDLGPFVPDLILGQPSATYPAPFPAPPQVESQGGQVLAHPRIVPVFFSNDDPQLIAETVAFENRIGASAFWNATTSEYGVGAATTTPPVMLAEASTGTLDDRQIGAWLGAKVTAADPAFPEFTDDDLYVLHYPAGTSITLQGSKSCSAFGAYHANTNATIANRIQHVAYAVIPRCSANGKAATIDDITSPTSHELVEAVTDPYPYAPPLGYSLVDADHAYWGVRGGELSDMCENFSSSYMRFPPELPYLVQRSWSNAAVAAGHDPCVPPPAGQVYFNAVPELPDEVSISVGQQLFDVLGVQIPVGQSKTILLDLYSDGPTGGPWNVTVQNSNPGRQYLAFQLSRSSGQNGEKLALTITSTSESASGAARFVIISSLNGQSHSWFGEVAQSQ